MTRLSVPEDADGERLDVVLARVGGMSRARAGALIDAGSVRVNDTVARKSLRVASSDAIEVVESEVDAVEVPSGIVVRFEDDDLLVVDKPAGVVVHAGAGVRGGTLVDALRAEGRPLASRAGEDRPGIVHRLDRDVSGLLVVAKTDRAHEALVAAMQRRDIDRRYLALVHGSPDADRGKIDAPVGRSAKHRTRMAVTPDGRPAVTWFEVRERLEDLALLDVKLETGRTHQIRTHLASIGHPIVGDSAYGRDPARARELGLRRPFLHAYRLSFAHPVSGDDVTVTSELPADLSAALEALRA
jgi:23S rRNA pseudouridine1911/1915/1917 synthase